MAGRRWPEVRGAYRPGPDLPLWLSPEESAAITLARRVLGQLGLPEAARLSHLEARCAVRDETGMSAETGLLPSVPGQVDPGIWSAVLLAIGTGRRVRLTYRKQTGEMAAPVLLDRIEPCWMTGAIYLVAIKAEALAGPFDWQALREYRLDRVLALDVTEAPAACRNFRGCVSSFTWMLPCTNAWLTSGRRKARASRKFGIGRTAPCGSSPTRRVWCGPGIGFWRWLRIFARLRVRRRWLRLFVRRRSDWQRH